MIKKDRDTAIHVSGIAYAFVYVSDTKFEMRVNE